MSSLKQQTIFGFFWRFLQNAGTQVIGFIVSIILARILMPSDYGLTNDLYKPTSSIIRNNKNFFQSLTEIGHSLNNVDRIYFDEARSNV